MCTPILWQWYEASRELLLQEGTLFLVVLSHTTWQTLPTDWLCQCLADADMQECLSLLYFGTTITMDSKCKLFHNYHQHKEWHVQNQSVFY